MTGVLNNETIEVMKAPRCGVSDISRYGHFPGRPRWTKRLITYRWAGHLTLSYDNPIGDFISKQQQSILIPTGSPDTPQTCPRTRWTPPLPRPSGSTAMSSHWTSNRSIAGLQTSWSCSRVDVSLDQAGHEQKLPNLLFGIVKDSLTHCTHVFLYFC